MLKTCLLGCLLTTQVAWSMDYVTTYLYLGRRWEEIGNQEFLLANEALEDYIGGLPRPTEAFKTFKYKCQVKSRQIRPLIQQTSANPPLNNTYVQIRFVYDIKDCERQ